MRRSCRAWRRRSPPQPSSGHHGRSPRIRSRRGSGFGIGGGDGRESVQIGNNDGAADGRPRAASTGPGGDDHGPRGDREGADGGVGAHGGVGAAGSRWHVGRTDHGKRRQTMSTELVEPGQQGELAYRHELTVEEVVARVKKVKDVTKALMVEHVHYGVVPGTDKPTLF